MLNPRPESRIENRWSRIEERGVRILYNPAHFFYIVIPLLLQGLLLNPSQKFFPASKEHFSAAAANTAMSYGNHCLFNISKSFEIKHLLLYRAFIIS